MSFETIEERVEKLEQANEKLLGLIRVLENPVLKRLELTQLSAVKLIMNMNADIGLVTRFIAEHPIFGDAKLRQALLDVVARSESIRDQHDAKLNDLIWNLEETIAPIPPPGK